MTDAIDDIGVTGTGAARGVAGPGRGCAAVNVCLLLDMAAEGFADRVVVGRRSAGLTADRVRRLSISGAGHIREAGADSVL